MRSLENRQTRSKHLLVQCSNAFERSKKCRFISDATLGQLSDSVWQSYVFNELSFVHTAELLIGQIITTLPQGYRQQWKAIQINLRDEQAPYLCGLLTVGRENDILTSSDDALSRHVSDVATSDGYYAFEVSMFAAENLYQQWCREAWKYQNAAKLDALGEWIGLHTGAAFKNSVKFWNDAVDRIDSNIQDEILEGWCQSMLNAELEFHNSAYDNLTQSNDSRFSVGEDTHA